MKKIIFLIMLLLVSKLSYSQNTNTNLTNCYSDAQVSEIFKGLKQNEYLKLRLSKTEATLKEADNLVNKQQEALYTKSEIIYNKDILISGLKDQAKIEEDIKRAQIEQLNNEIDFEIERGNEKSRKSFWKGIKTGGIVGAAAAVIGILLLK